MTLSDLDVALFPGLPTDCLSQHGCADHHSRPASQCLFKMNEDPAIRCCFG